MKLLPPHVKFKGFWNWKATMKRWGLALSSFPVNLEVLRKLIPSFLFLLGSGTGRESERH